MAVAPEQLDKKRACDGCRVRKRKCDGLLPYCTNCKKAILRDKDGNPICTYSLEVKKRGPKKGHRGVETMTARVSMLESILEPLAKRRGVAAKTLNRVKNDHIDGLLQIETHYEGSAPPISTGTQMASPRLTFALNCRNADFEPVQIVPVLPDEEEFELSLFRLGLQFSSVASNYRLSVVLTENHNHLKLIHQSLRLALCANGLFYSKHPYLAALLRNENFSNQTSPLFSLVGEYLDQALKSIPEKPSSELEIIDSFRALMVIVTVYFSLGDCQSYAAIRAKINSLIIKWHLFDPFVFNPNITKLGISVDSLRIEFAKSSDKFVPPILSPEGMQERFALWEECMAMDSFCSMISGENFDMDELDYPPVFQNPAVDYKSNHSLDLNLERVNLTIYNGARNSIWGAESFAKVFDEIKEITAVSAIHFSASLIQFRVAMIKISRRAMRFSRERLKGVAHRYATDTLEGIHNLIIQQIDVLPSSITPFLSLEAAVNGNPGFHQDSKWKFHISFNQDFLLFLVSLTYIHLPNCQSYALYSLSSHDETSKFTSAGVLAAVLKALAGIIRVLYQFETFPQNFGLPYPAPGLCSMQSCVALYMIASAAVAGVRYSENQQLQFEILEDISIWVVPALSKIAKVIPMAKEYHDKLIALVKTFQT